KHLADLLLLRANTNPRLAEWGTKLPDLIQLMCAEPEAFRVLTEKRLRNPPMTKKELRLYLLRLACDVRDQLTDIRSLLAYSSKLACPTTWHSVKTPVTLVDQLPTLGKMAEPEQWIVVRALLREVEHLPGPKTIEDALRPYFP